jgi:hypothetical protein
VARHGSVLLGRRSGAQHPRQNARIASWKDNLDRSRNDCSPTDGGCRVLYIQQTTDIYISMKSSRTSRLPCYVNGSTNGRTDGKDTA